MNTLQADPNTELCRLCREGMLYEVEAWIREGRSIAPEPDGDGPLAVSASRGFHSLVKLLLDQGYTQEALDRALTAATIGGNLEVVRLLLEHGAKAAMVCARDVVSSPNPDVALLLYSRGVDMETGYPLAHALAYKSKEALALFARYRKEIPTLQIQAAMVLRHSVLNDDERWITQLIRAGANPRLPAPKLYPEKNERVMFSALHDAAVRGSFRLLWRLGVRKTDDFEELLELACWDIDPAKIRFLIQRGARINDQPGGGSSVLHQCLMALGDGNHYRLRSFHERAERAWDLAKELIAKGAQWMPDKDDIRHARMRLSYAAPDRCADAAELLIKNNAAPRESVAKLFGTPMMRKHLGHRIEELRGLLRGSHLRGQQDGERVHGKRATSH